MTGHAASFRQYSTSSFRSAFSLLYSCRIPCHKRFSWLGVRPRLELRDTIWGNYWWRSLHQSLLQVGFGLSFFLSSWRILCHKTLSFPPSWRPVWSIDLIWRKRTHLKRWLVPRPSSGGHLAEGFQGLPPPHGKWQDFCAQPSVSSHFHP